MLVQIDVHQGVSSHRGFGVLYFKSKGQIGVHRSVYLMSYSINDYRLWVLLPIANTFAFSGISRQKLNLSRNLMSSYDTWTASLKDWRVLETP